MAPVKLMVPGAEPAGQMEVVSPYDLSSVAAVETGGLAAVDHALSTAERLFRDRSSWIPAHRRLAILERTAELMAERFDELVDQAVAEGGKPLTDSRVEVNRSISSVKVAIETLRTDAGSMVPMGINEASAGRMAAIRKEPIGPVVAVSAFNHPFNLIAHQVAPAVATGCPVIVKPADDTPLSAMSFVQILHEAGLPPEWAQGIVTDDLETAEALATDRRVAFFSFIGSAKVGWMLRSKLAPGCRVALEHGGAAPVIVTEDADLEVAVPPILKGGYYHAGQVCVSVQRIFAHHSIRDALVDRIVAGAEALKVGDPRNEETDVGPLIRPKEVERVASWVDEAREAGALVACGGERLSETFYKPTVLVEPAPELAVSAQEIFGPVVCVYGFDDMDEAIARANSLPYAFQAAIFTSNLDAALRAADRLDGSAVMINDHTAFRVDWMPFAGLRQSGLGTGGIPYTMEDMTVDKMIVFKSNALQ
ncbi:MAG: aldehyde dehydrogenase family protein [Geminicoccaceae bacterium]